MKYAKAKFGVQYKPLMSTMNIVGENIPTYKSKIYSKDVLIPREIFLHWESIKNEIWPEVWIVRYETKKI